MCRTRGHSPAAKRQNEMSAGPPWCKGSTSDFGSEGPGSNPGGGAVAGTRPILPRPDRPGRRGVPVDTPMLIGDAEDHLLAPASSQLVRKRQTAARPRLNHHLDRYLRHLTSRMLAGPLQTAVDSPDKGAPVSVLFEITHAAQARWRRLFIRHRDRWARADVSPAGSPGAGRVTRPDSTGGFEVADARPMGSAAWSPAGPPAQ